MSSKASILVLVAGLALLWSCGGSRNAVPVENVIDICVRSTVEVTSSSYFGFAQSVTVPFIDISPSGVFTSSF